jgi:endonuclease-3
MTIKERYRKVIQYFQVNMPVAETELKYSNPFELTVAVILSAQCTDKRVNKITPVLLKQFPTPQVMAETQVEEIFSIIRSCSYPNNKAKHLSGMAAMVTSNYQGQIPHKVEELMKLPGVGRKSANVISMLAFGTPTMPVDTHVFRVSARIGLTHNAKTPGATEKQLLRHLPPHLLSIAHHWLILHGRYVCQARKPKCHECGLQHSCKYFTQLRNRINM